MMRMYLVIISFLVLSQSYAQEKQETNLLTFKDRANFYELNYFYKRENVLRQSIEYNEPSVLDEEYWYSLILIFKNDFDQLSDSIFDLAIDTNVVKSEFFTFSFWDMMDGDIDTSFQVSGYIEILEITKNTITIKEDILIVDATENKKFTLVGIRTFTKKRYKNSVAIKWE